MKLQARRALVVIRLSRVTDATTSPARQLEACLELCKQRGYEVIGTAEDLDVSAGKTSPFDRPQLGDWLTNRRGSSMYWLHSAWTGLSVDCLIWPT
ncbi:recombinase family protein [Mycobacteroides chelonae]|nr:recombinase family protein [Mycobacteroides chelonae]